MRLTKLVISQFRNIETVSVKPCANFNLLYGLNGQGKTNLLEAIYLLGNSRSFRTSRLSELLRHGEQQARIAGEIESGNTIGRVQLTLEPGGKKVLLDGKSVQRASNLHGMVNAVVFSPDDTSMVKLGPEARRRYLDRVVYTSTIAYLHHWHEYHRILKQRNFLLKHGDTSGLAVWTEKLAESGAQIIYYRLQYVATMNRRLQYHYRVIAGEQETVDVHYLPIAVTHDDISGIQSDLLKNFDATLAQDQRYGSTTAGPHRDDLLFLLNGRALKAFGSQGQQKTYVLALKMAEMEHLHTVFDEPPLLLLDDMSSELDAQRNSNLMDFIINSNIQVFMTTTDRLAPASHLLKECAIFNVHDGHLTFEGNELYE